jgi:hypothetical protein
VRNIVICGVIKNIWIETYNDKNFVVITDGNNEAYYCPEELLPLDSIGNKFVVEVYDKPVYSYSKSDCLADAHMLRSIKRNYTK